MWGLLQGASFLPYLITDGIVAPESCRHCYSENLALMPNCYFVNDYKHAHMVRTPGSPAALWNAAAGQGTVHIHCRAYSLFCGSAINP